MVAWLVFEEQRETKHTEKTRRPTVATFVTPGLAAEKIRSQHSPAVVRAPSTESMVSPVSVLSIPSKAVSARPFAEAARRNESERPRRQEQKRNAF